MRKLNRFSRFVISAGIVFSLFGATVVAPTVNVNAATFGIPNAKKVLSVEQKKAKSALSAAKKDLAKKQKALKKAKATQKQTAANLSKLEGAAKASSTTAKVSAKALANARKQNKAALAAVARATTVRDIAKAKVIRLDARYAWLMEDLSTLECGQGTDITTSVGSIEHVFECGLVYEVVDGDTVHVKTTKNELVEVRNVGLQTPERKKGSNPPQCGAEAAYKNFVKLLPETTSVVQLRAIKGAYNYWGGMKRATRSVYKLNSATGLFDIDVQAAQVAAGWSMWWPTAAEWTHNQEYLDLMNTARAEGRGIWDSDLCGPAKGKVPQIWMSPNAPTIGSNTEPIFGEYAVLYNDSNSVIDLTGWSLRDNSLAFFYNSKSRKWMHKKNVFKKGTKIQPGKHLIVHLDNPKKYPLSASEYEYFNWSRESLSALLINPSIRGAYAHGDSLHLQDKYGNMRNSITIPCSSTSMCTEPKWWTDIKATSGQIIPIPVALNKVANSTRDIYNPRVTFAVGANQVDTISYLTRSGFSGLAGATCDSKLPAGTTISISTSSSCTARNLKGKRVAIADLTGRIRTKVYVNKASGKNTMPNVVNLTETEAVAKLIAAGFQATVTGTGTQLVSGQSVVAGTSTELGAEVVLTLTP
jgi:endonuclease YncB( thermonuclease family)